MDYIYNSSISSNNSQLYSTSKAHSHTNENKILYIINIIGIALIWISLWYLGDIIYLSFDKKTQIVSKIFILIVGILITCYSSQHGAKT